MEGIGRAGDGLSEGQSAVKCTEEIQEGQMSRGKRRLGGANSREIAKTKVIIQRMARARQRRLEDVRRVGAVPGEFSFEDAAEVRQFMKWRWALIKRAKLIRGA
ncbi:hypothetical protein NDU88_002740 [Pleurodeles waltl]|uniref:Uncharacterized protein n=1 Tax=Pleurodeles waltl TaxID=8319 RepID=A0AAV7QCM9_PLEWA|nr:hypothetical protein NDU88_002740 [Pleurodeles waltl]